MYENVPGERDALIVHALKCLHERYEDPTKPGQALDFADPAIQFAYVFTYLACHACLVSRIVQRSGALQKLFRDGPPIVTSIGGGPGSDVIGVLKYLECEEACLFPPVRALDYFILDEEEAWLDVREYIWDELNTTVLQSSQHYTFDVREPGDYPKRRDYCEANLFVMMYFLSEIWSIRNDAETFFRDLLKRARSNSIFLLIDNNKSIFFSYFRRLAEESSAILSEGPPGIEWRVPCEKGWLVLKEYKEKFGYYPKLTANIRWEVWVKK